MVPRMDAKSTKTKIMPAVSLMYYIMERSMEGKEINSRLSILFCAKLCNQE